MHQQVVVALLHSCLQLTDAVAPEVHGVRGVRKGDRAGEVGITRAAVGGKGACLRVKVASRAEDCDALRDLDVLLQLRDVLEIVDLRVRVRV